MQPFLRRYMKSDDVYSSNNSLRNFYIIVPNCTALTHHVACHIDVAKSGGISTTAADSHKLLFRTILSCKLSSYKLNHAREY